jgi:outer membrane scaffolding protein for murein synthesis (MipA/OmpV family)
MSTLNLFIGGRLGGLVILCLAAAPVLAHAKDWIVTVGGRAVASPPYEGAPNDDIRPAFTFSIRPADKLYRFTPPDDASTFALFASRHIDFGPALRFRYSRGDTGRLQGFDKIGVAVEPGLFADVWPTDWLRGRVEVRRGVTGHAGWVGDAGIDLIHTGHKWHWSVGPRIGYGDRRYIDTYFGVTPLEAQRSPYLFMPYEPAGGIRYFGWEAALAYQVTRRLRTTLDFGYHRLVGIAADSPVVSIAGSRDQYLGGIGLSYSFGVRIGHHR